MFTRKAASRVLVLTVGAALGVLLVVATNVAASPPAQAPTPVQEAALLSPVFHFQGRLLDPGTGQPKPDGTYSMSFRLYNVETGGSALWSETKNVTVNGGLFSTLLGDTTPLNLSHFNGQALWLGITVGADPEATPRPRVASVGYALYAGDADKVDGQHAADFAAASHAHSGADITSGTVAEPRIDSAIARDSEIMPTVLGSDGAGSGLDADLLDGQQASAFATAGHDHDTRYYTESESDSRYVNDNAGEVGNADVTDGALSPAKIAGTAWTSTNDGSGSGLNADLLDGLQASAFHQGYSGIQVNQTTPLAAGGQAYWFTFGYSPDQLVVWWAKPTTNGGKLRLEVESEYVASDNTITWWLRVFNTGSVATTYQLIRYTFYP